ncbi:unnamed protein product [Closterium sp. NIES-54]
MSSPQEPSGEQEPKPMNTDLNRPSRKRSMPKKFSREVKDACWNKADVVKGRDPDRWRQDSEGNMVFRAFDSCDGPFCFEYDRIVPRNKGGDSSVDNCTIRQVGSQCGAAWYGAV